MFSPWVFPGCAPHPSCPMSPAQVPETPLEVCPEGLGENLSIPSSTSQPLWTRDAGNRISAGGQA